MPTVRLFVSNVAWKVDDNELQTFCQRFTEPIACTVSTATVQKHAVTGLSRGFAFITVKGGAGDDSATASDGGDESWVDTVITALNGQSLRERALIVERATKTIKASHKRSWDDLSAAPTAAANA